jgi:hypothetical protein
MHMPEESRLEAECHSLCRYLIGKSADPYVSARYIQAHALGSVGPPTGERDAVLAWAAAQSPVLAGFADAYASVFARDGLLRRKLALMLALLETRLETYRALDAPTTTSRAALIVRLCATTCAMAVRAAIAAAAFVPLLAVYRLAAGRRSRQH